MTVDLIQHRLLHLRRSRRLGADREVLNVGAVSALRAEISNLHLTSCRFRGWVPGLARRGLVSGTSS